MLYVRRTVFHNQVSKKKHRLADMIPCGIVRTSEATVVRSKFEFYNCLSVERESDQTAPS